MMTLYTELLYRPLLNLVVFLYNIIPGHDFGLAIIVLTAIVRVIFLPLTVKSVLSQRALNKINPKIKEIKEKYKNNPTVQQAAILQLYKDSNVNPVAGCLPLLVQFPILIALYQVFNSGFKPENLTLLYGFIHNPKLVNEVFLGILNITKPNYLLTILAGGLQFLQARQMKDSNKNAEMSKEMTALNSQMLYFFPIIIIIIGWNLPAGLMLYWITTTALSIAEQAYIRRKYK